MKLFTRQVVVVRKIEQTHSMIDGLSPFYQATLGTLFTWGLTALGSALVFIFQSGKVSVNTAHIYITIRVWRSLLTD